MPFTFLQLLIFIVVCSICLYSIIARICECVEKKVLGKFANTYLEKTKLEMERVQNNILDISERKFGYRVEDDGK